MDHEHVWVLITKYLSKEATEPEIDELKKLLESNREAEQLFQQVSAVWNKKGKAPHSDRYQLESNKQELLRNIHRLEQEKTKRQSPVNKPTVRFPWTQVAATAGILLMAAAIYLWNPIETSQEAAIPNWILLENPKGKRSVHRLPDGSKVYLNTHSKLRFQEGFNGSVRALQLEGEAYFEVVKNPEKPFVVHTGEVATKVLGTSFNVRAFAHEEALQISLVEGKVEVSNPQSAKDTAVYLAPLEQYTFVKSAASGAISQGFDPSVLTAWKENVLILDNEPMDVVAQKLENWYGISVQLSHAGIARCRLKARFENEALPSVMQVLEYANNLSCAYHGDTLFISGKGCY
ncbi:FecR domain-containing protein [Rapidithrix thailandica]|uniref:FecR domain-containing protein n=1 Tax=Rapidithrix thailandica TaxID=413964 RepID=A0AAW9RNE2_9BACT